MKSRNGKTMTEDAYIHSRTMMARLTAKGGLQNAVGLTYNVQKGTMIVVLTHSLVYHTYVMAEKNSQGRSTAFIPEILKEVLVTMKGLVI